MTLIYITGVSGSGKSTVRLELLRRGYKAFGGSEDNIAAFYNNVSGRQVRSFPVIKHSSAWLSRHTWKIPKETIKKLKLSAKGQLIFVCSSALNDEDGLWSLFDRIIALTIDEDTLRSRLATRRNNDWGKTPNEIEFIVAEQRKREEEYQKFGAIFIDSTQPVNAIVDEILAQAKSLA